MTIRLNWGVGIFLVYAVFTAGTITMVGIAASNHVELVSDDYYARSLAVDAQMLAAERGRLSDVRIELMPTASGQTLRITWPMATTADAGGVLTLYRPSMAAADRTMALAPRPGSAQVIPLAGLAPGHWNLQLRWTSDAHEHYVERSLLLP